MFKEQVAILRFPVVMVEIIIKDHHKSLSRVRLLCLSMEQKVLEKVINF